jgi:NADH-quinone oxidoreductase subunit M
MALGVAGILYGALQAFGQDDLKRLIAYTSVSHMGFVALGIFAGTEAALQGVVLQMLCHGISTGALFIIAGALQERLGTRDMAAMGGLWNTMPKMAGAGLIFGLASLGLPGTGNFAAEFLVLLGSFSVSPLAVSVSALGLVAAAAYSLRMVQRVFCGPKPEGPHHADLSPRELAVMAVMTGLIVLAGLYPQPVFSTAEQPLKRLTAPIAPAPPPGAASQVRTGEGSGR